MFFSRLEELIYVLKENYASYRVKPDRPAPIQPQGTYTTQIHTVSEEQEFSPSQSEQDIATFKPQQRQQQRPQQNYNNRGNNCSHGQNYRSNNNNCQNHNQPRTNAARNGKFCIYCKIMNQTQEECPKRINDNKPCVTNKGHMYWPKINTTNDSPNTVQQNSNSNIVESDFDPTVFH
jgi:hypothetical protein